jgi:hypothetical protein
MKTPSQKEEGNKTTKKTKKFSFCLPLVCGESVSQAKSKAKRENLL